MDSLLLFYNDNYKFSTINDNVFDLFAQFYNEADLTPIFSWLETQFAQKTTKNNSTSVFYRGEGNALYCQKDLMKTLDLYTKSLCHAIPESKEYGMALANRSAVSFKLKFYDNCIKDIDLCLSSEYPKDLRPKVLMRKAACYLEMGQKVLLDECIVEVEKLLESGVHNKDKLVERLNQLKNLDLKHPSKVTSSPSKSEEIPTFPHGENPNFAYASSKIRLSYSTSKGRHVLANTKIDRGDILFIEKAFAFAPVFQEDTKDLHPFTCYNCFKTVLNALPCKTCTKCAFCNEECRELSWNSCHQWECLGMQTNMWYETGIAFPALKTTLKGCNLGFGNVESKVESSPEQDVQCFGDKLDNYRYFDGLVSHVYGNINAKPYVTMAAIIVTYLKKYTGFFEWFLKEPHCPEKDANALELFVGGTLAKHIGTLAFNSSAIEHWTSTSEDMFAYVIVPKGCGVFPSVSMMNHSCKTNVTNYFICDTIVVKALHGIAKDQEIWNCYGVDYRAMPRSQRLHLCENRYFFKCTCEICLDPSKELDQQVGYLCPKCKNIIPDISGTESCLGCGDTYNLKPLRKLNDQAQKYVEDFVQTGRVELLTKSLKIREQILSKHHRAFEDVYYKLYNWYLEKGNLDNIFKYFQLWLDNENARLGYNSRIIGMKLYELALGILHRLHAGQLKNTNLKQFLENLERMIKEAKAILNLYYPDFITDKLVKKINLLRGNNVC